MTTIPLITEAVTTNKHGETHRYPVHVELKDGRPVLRIERTMGSWYLSTLLGVDFWGGGAVKEPSDRLAIDFGQQWVCTNMRALISEALARVLGETDLGRFEKKNA